jgi:hypothetical protein
MMKKTILSGFIRAHLGAEKKLVDYFGLRGKVDTPEVARCLLQSKVFVYKAIKLLCLEESKLSKELLEEMAIAEECRAAAEDCAKFIKKVKYNGVLTNVEAESMLHPLYDSIQKFIQDVKDAHKGQVDARLSLHGEARMSISDSEKENGNGHASNGKRTSEVEETEPLAPQAVETTAKPKASVMKKQPSTRSKVVKVKNGAAASQKAEPESSDSVAKASPPEDDKPVVGDPLPAKLGRPDTPQEATPDADNGATQSEPQEATKKKGKKNFKTRVKTGQASNVAATDDESGASYDQLWNESKSVDKTPLLSRQDTVESKKSSAEAIKEPTKKTWVKRKKEKAASVTTEDETVE